MRLEATPCRAESTAQQAALKGVQQVQQRLRTLRGAAPEDTDPGKATKAVKAQCERGGSDQVGHPFGAGTAFRVQITEKDQSDVEVFRVGQAAWAGR